MQMVCIAFGNIKNFVINFYSQLSIQIYPLKAAIFIFTIIVTFFLHLPLKEYQESSTLTLNYIIENHSLIDVDVVFRPSRIIIPNSGKQTSNCACSVLNLGKNFNIGIFLYINLSTYIIHKTSCRSNCDTYHGANLKFSN